jgi:hypothetical protein
MHWKLERRYIKNSNDLNAWLMLKQRSVREWVQKTVTGMHCSAGKELYILILFECVKEDLLRRRRNILCVQSYVYWYGIVEAKWSTMLCIVV